MRIITSLFFFSLLYLNTNITAQTIYEPLRLEDLDWESQDFGHMWTFDAVPFEDFRKDLNFSPDQDWLDDVRKSALQFGRGCSGSFVSASGLIMTNHHCCRGYLLQSFENGGEILEKGYYAESAEKEVVMKGLYVDQLIDIRDVTDRIVSGMESVEQAEEKTRVRDSLSALIQQECQSGTGLVCKVVKLYQGGKYSLYTYKRYSDVRLVMAPSFQLASTGWDWDNYTYPRYELDMAFFRAYDSLGNPVKSENFYQWNSDGAEVDEPVFVVGRPGSTARLISYREMTSLRDVSLPILLDYYNARFKMHFNYFEMHPEKASELFSTVLGVSNGRKRYAGRYLGVKDKMVQAKKKKFEESLKSNLADQPELGEKYMGIWESIEEILDELDPLTREYYSMSLPRSWFPSVFKTAENLVEYGEEMQKDPGERSKFYKKENLASTKEGIFEQVEDREMDSLKAIFLKDFWETFDYEGKPEILDLFELAEEKDPHGFLQGLTILDDEISVNKMVKGKPEKILISEDKIIMGVLEIRERLRSIEKQREQLRTRLSIENQKLGELVFAIYGNDLPPDGTGTLRISEGRVRGYEYNGTLAPPKTTYYGLYDRYNSFGKKPYPWGLDEVWKEPQPGFDLSTPINFVSTTDIVGGNSGSAIINRNAEVIGLAFDGNMEGITGYYMYLPDKNRTVGVDSKGMIEALRSVYKYERITKELETGSLKE